MADGAALQIDGLHGFYGESHVLHGLSLAVDKGEAVAIIGRNGAGKTTTMRAIMGLLERRSGSIKVKGKETIASPPETIARLGVGFVPEERGHLCEPRRHGQSAAAAEAGGRRREPR